MRHVLALPLTLAMSACAGPVGWVGTVHDGGTGDCSATRISSGASALVSSGAAWPGEFTFEGWYRLDGAPAAPFGRIAGVEATGACASGVNLWELRISQGGYVTATLGAAYASSGTGAPVAMGQWFHVALQYEGAGSGALYLNGTRVQTFAFLGGTMNLPNGCDVRLASATDGTSNLVPMSVASLHYRRFKHYVDGFVPSPVLERDADTLYLFDPPTSQTLPVSDGIYVFSAPSSVPVASGPGC